jgi:L-fuculose-phosphate aldolase
MHNHESDETIRFEMAAARRIMAAAGLDRDDIAGQVTVRVANEDSLWTTPMDLFEATLPEHVVKLPFGTRATDGRLIEVDGSAVPVSSASAWVEAIYRARSEVGCIIHTHAPYIGAVASTGEVIGLYNNRSVIFYDEQAFYEDDGTGTDSPERIVDALGSRSVLIQRNHGAVVTGPNVRIATAAAPWYEIGEEVPKFLKRADRSLVCCHHEGSREVWDGSRSDSSRRTADGQPSTTCSSRPSLSTRGRPANLEVRRR